MRLFTKESWSYAVLMVILLAIAAIAVGQAISFLLPRIPQQDTGSVTAMLWSITMGFMFIAGAFGLWSIQFAAGAESRRRISEIVASMDYLQDGLLAVDTHDRVIASNPAAREILSMDSAHSKRSLIEIFSAFRAEDVDLLLHNPIPQEVERVHIEGGMTRTLRFRSQPTRGITLILVSDVTAARVRRQQRQQSAKLQLVGQLARAVANDFNNLLCGISGHAALLPRLPPGAAEIHDSIRSIADSAERGIALAGHLMALSRPLSSSAPARLVGDHVLSAANTLRDTLPSEWQVETDIKDIPSTSLTGMQIEQMVLNLGQVLAEDTRAPDLISVIVGPPGSHPLLNIANRFAGGIVLARAGSTDARIQSESSVDAEDVGLVLAVIRSILDGAGGELHQLTATEGRRPMFRIALPIDNTFDSGDEQIELPFDIERYVANWNVLIAGSPKRHAHLVRCLEQLDVRIKLVESVADILAETNAKERLEAVIIDWTLLGSQEEGALKALVKLSPESGIVVMRDAKPRLGAHELPGVVCVQSRAGTDRILMAMVEARSLATARSHKKPATSTVA